MGLKTETSRCPNQEIYHLKCGQVKTRKDHKCFWCTTKVIPAGTKTQRCAIVIPDEGKVETRYYCDDCLKEMEL